METTISQSVSVPEGWKLVPVEPTDTMREACPCHEYHADIDADWAAMLAAAPAAPTPQPQADDDLPPLPNDPAGSCEVVVGREIVNGMPADIVNFQDGYSADQMRAYAISARLVRTAAQSRNFCPECGKPTPPESIHTCTPPARIAAPSEPAETIQWRNIKHVVQEIAKFCFGDGSHPQYGSAYIAVTSALTAKDGLQVMLEPLHATPMSAVNKMLETSQLDELGHEVARLQTALCFWLPSVTDREDEVADRILQDAFLLCGIDGNIPDDFKTAQELGWVTLATAPQVPEPSAPAPLEAQPIPTDLSKRLRSQASTHLVAMIRQDILAAADEIDRYYGGMLAWKKTAEEKDAASTSLWNALDLMVSTFERPIGMYANECRACEIARVALTKKGQL